MDKKWRGRFWYSWMMGGVVYARWQFYLVNLSSASEIHATLPTPHPPPPPIAVPHSPTPHIKTHTQPLPAAPILYLSSSRSPSSANYHGRPAGYPALRASCGCLLGSRVPLSRCARLSGGDFVSARRLDVVVRTASL